MDKSFSILVYGAHSDIDEGDYEFEFDKNVFELKNISDDIDILR